LEPGRDALRIGVVLALRLGCYRRVVVGDDEQAPATTQKAAAKGANQVRLSLRLLGPLDKAYAKMDADSDGNTEEVASGGNRHNGRVKASLALKSAHMAKMAMAT
jgi:hypothetical protein